MNFYFLMTSLGFHLKYFNFIGWCVTHFVHFTDEPRQNEYLNLILTFWPPNYSIWIFTHLKLCLADAIHNFKWVKNIQIWQNGGQLFSNIADWCHILSLTCLKGGTYCANKKENPTICGTGGYRVKHPFRVTCRFQTIDVCVLFNH